MTGARRAAPWFAAAWLALAPAQGRAQEAHDWPPHDLSRPAPPRVDAGRMAAPPAAPPSDAIVLFDGGAPAEWQAPDGGPAGWVVRDGVLEVAPGRGGIRTRRAFGDVQLHLEWAAPAPPSGSGQDRGNSGVFLMGLYEVQILDSYENPTYADGQAAAVYGQHPPLVNASRPPGEWQSYDIVFRRPRFDANGELLEPARMTVFHNGVLVHDAVELMGPTAHGRRPPFAAHADRLPLGLQDHGQPVRFRNIWVRDLER